MLKRLALVLIGLSVSFAAYGDGTVKIECLSAKDTKLMREDIEKMGKWAPLTPGQFHFLEGMYYGAPPVGGHVPGDGAVIATATGDKGGMILWTRAGNACLPISGSHVSHASMAARASRRDGHIMSE